ncbi:MAG TPA: hypothetical protein VFI54_04855 [Solirubrobacteraceae bacterium]|nr:hypothetical protein [Solirubrobacteraceae bacterium]
MSIVVKHVMPRASTFAVRQAAAPATEAWVTLLLVTGFIPACQAPRSRSTAGRDGAIVRTITD